MSPSRIDSMLTLGIAFDIETHRIQPGLLAPPIVCGSVGWFSDGKIEGRLLDKDQALQAASEILGGDHVMVGANIAFDLMVVASEAGKRGEDAFPTIFKALEEDRVYDLLIAEGLNAVADGCLNSDPRTGGSLINLETGKPGRYSLATCVDLVLGRRDAKANDEWRQRYAELEHVPMVDWPQPARDYPIDDAKNTIECALAQAGHLPKITVNHTWGRGPDGASKCDDCGATQIGQLCLTTRPHRNLHDLANQVWTAFVMHDGATWGFHVNQASVDIIERHALKNRANGIQPFKDAGLVRVDDTEDRSALKRLVACAYGSSEPCPVCEGTGKVPSRSNPKSRIICHEIDPDTGEKLKTCDGTGYVLAHDVPRSEKDGVGYGRDVLHESGDDKLLMPYGDFLEDKKDLVDYVPYLRTARVPAAGHADDCPRIKKDDACTCPGPYRDIPLTLKPNVLLETGRTSYSGYIQLFKRQPGYYVELEDGTKEYVPSLRECIEARRGRVLCSADFEAGELVTHAQSCIWICGESDLAKALVGGVKVHNALAATMLGMPYEEFQRRAKEKTCKDARQAAKPPGFGYPGGMGPAKLVLQQRKQGPDTPHPNGPNWILDDDRNPVRGYKGLRFCILMDGADVCGETKVTEWRDRKIPPTCLRCIECAVRLKEYWLRQWPENKRYFNYVSDCVEQGQMITPEMLWRWPHLAEVFCAGQRLAPGEIMQHVSGRIRGGVEFCSCANGFFQGLLGDLAKSAVRRIGRECRDRTYRVPAHAHPASQRSAYAGMDSPLYGSRLIVFQHDEVLPELLESQMHDAAMRVTEVMEDEMAFYCPDLAPAARAPAALMRRWDKRAEPRWARGGDKPAGKGDKLIIWEPKSCPAEF